MKQYIAIKPIEAKPMTRGDYNEYRGWTIPDDENPCDEGYLIKRNDGYVTWLAKETFENDYKEIDSLANKANDVNVTVSCHGANTNVILNGTDISGHVRYIKFEQSADTCNSLTMALDAVNFDFDRGTVK